MSLLLSRLLVVVYLLTTCLMVFKVLAGESSFYMSRGPVYIMVMAFGTRTELGSS